MLACYLVAKEGYTADKAIEETRRRRCGSIETQSQEQMVRVYEDSLKTPAPGVNDKAPTPQPGFNDEAPTPQPGGTDKAPTPHVQ